MCVFRLTEGMLNSASSLQLPCHRDRNIMVAVHCNQGIYTIVWMHAVSVSCSFEEYIYWASLSHMFVHSFIHHHFTQCSYLSCHINQALEALTFFKSYMIICAKGKIYYNQFSFVLYCFPKRMVLYVSHLLLQLVCFGFTTFHLGLIHHVVYRQTEMRKNVKEIL